MAFLPPDVPAGNRREGKRGAVTGRKEEGRIVYNQCEGYSWVGFWVRLDVFYCQIVCKMQSEIYFTLYLVECKTTRIIAHENDRVLHKKYHTKHHALSAVTQSKILSCTQDLYCKELHCL